MAKIDRQLTKDIQDWLLTDNSKRDVAKGAEMLLALTRNRALTTSYLRNPHKFEAKVVYELKKHLKIRLHNMSVVDVANLEQTVMLRVADTVETAPAISVNSEFPEATIARGRREDHESLPQHIRELWDSNKQTHQKIVLLFNELKGMSDMQPCDRYEKLSILDQLDRRYRDNLAAYDAYVAPPSPTPEIVSQPEAKAPINSEKEKQMNAARKTLSKYKKRCREAEDQSTKALAITKIQQAVDTIRLLGGDFSDSSVAELREFGISID